MARIGRKPKAQDALDLLGLDWVCGQITGAETLTAIAVKAEVSLTSLLTWIDSDSVRSVRVREARASTAKLWDERAEAGLANALDPFDLSKAKELAHHYRWRAVKIAPAEYGDKVEHTAVVTLAELVARSGLKVPGVKG